MKMLLNEKTKQEKIMNEVQKKRNLFGLGLTSLIAACGATDSATNDTTATIDIGTIPQTDLEADPFPVTPLANEIESTAVILDGQDLSSTGGLNRIGKYDLMVTVKKASAVVDDDAANDFAATFRNGNHLIRVAEVSAYQGLVEDKNSLVVASSQFGDPAGTAEVTGAIYILWDIKNGGTIDNVDTGTSPNYLKVAGFKAAGVTDVIPNDAPKFYHIGGVTVEGTDTEQPDMVFRSGATADAATNINILWDVTQHAAEIAATHFTLASDATSAGILQVQGSREADPEFRKINNNEDYDIIVYGENNTYILWDVANYHDVNAETKTVVDLTGANEDAAATHGLLTIEGLESSISSEVTDAENGLIDIDGGGINDIVFVYIDGKTYILFGEKVANRDKYGKAISHSIDMTEVAGSMGKFFDKNGDEVTEFADPATAIEGFFHYDLDGTGEVKNVGYRLSGENNFDDIKRKYADAVNPPADEGAGTLSEEVYWDIA